jgi:DNA-directed RNA polymerase subunit RPC12/RpoP
MERFTYRTCHKCGHKFKGKQHGEHEVRLTIIQNDKPVTYTSYACPKCNAYNVYVCPTCNQVVNKVHGETEGTFAYECPRCLDSEDKPTRYPHWIERSKPQMYRYTQYMLGFQETIKGQNIKSITMIDENGNTFTNWIED